jgi:nucleotidyltransferase substrate binding protein (TIGR01987 family)
MNSQGKRFFDDFEKALNNLKQGISKEKDDLDIDGTIKRFELCYELSWKLMKEYLADKGIVVKNPRDSFKQAYINDLIDEEETWILMIDDRNCLIHVYTPEISHKIFNHIKNSYVTAFEHLCNKIKIAEINLKIFKFIFNQKSILAKTIIELEKISDWDDWSDEERSEKINKYLDF